MANMGDTADTADGENMADKVYMSDGENNIEVDPAMVFWQNHTL
jgi:hypothetical protein